MEPEITNNTKQECKCIGEKKAKALEKQIVELNLKIVDLEKQILILRKAVKK